MKLAIELSEERKAWVCADLAQGSDPRPAFFFLVGVSTIIASLGLVMNSTAVVIGAMLVAPLMTPILGLALALVRGDPKLIAIALRAEVLGVGVSIAVASIFGLALPSYFDATPEMPRRSTLSSAPWPNPEPVYGRNRTRVNTQLRSIARAGLRRGRTADQRCHV